MKQRNPLSFRHIALFVLPVFLGGLFFIYHTHATSASSANNNSIAGGDSLIYSTSDGSNDFVGVLPFSSNATQVGSDFGNSTIPNGDKQLFLSPDRKLIAVTVIPPGDDVWPVTYIASVDGIVLTSAQLGTFISWSPDSSKVLLYVSPTEAPWIRKIYALDTQGNYYDSGLPNGTINADISPVDGSILYSLTSGGSDDSTLYVRNLQGKDTLLIKGNGSIFAWARWSPTGNAIAFMKSDLWASPGQQAVWVIRPDGTGATSVSGVNWGYPPVWSPDGTRLAFSNAGNIWEYDPSAKSLHNASNLNEGSAIHPSYSADGKTIFFSANHSGTSQIWSARDGNAIQLTSDAQNKDYSLLP